jgi:hypothetical protein
MRATPHPAVRTSRRGRRLQARWTVLCLALVVSAVGVGVTSAPPALAAGSNCSPFIQNQENLWLQDACINVSSGRSVTGSSAVLYRLNFAGSHVRQALLYMRLQNTTTGRYGSPYVLDITADARIRNPKRYSRQLAIGAIPGHWYRVEAWMRVTTYSRVYDSSSGIGNHPFTSQIRCC